MNRERSPSPSLAIHRRWHPREKAHLYSIARGSALEAAAIVDLLHALRLGSVDECANARRMALRIGQMVAGLIRIVRARRG